MTEDLSYHLALLLAGFVYIVTPGPVFLAIVSLVSTQGRVAGLKFVSGAIFGCMIWLMFTCTSLIESGKLPKTLFIFLALACSSYLFFLGTKMFVFSVQKDRNTVFVNPTRDGFMLALFNPKSYPVMTSVFSGVSTHYLGLMQWSNFWQIFLMGVTGFALGYLFMILLAGSKPVTAFYTRHLQAVSILFGFIFYGFGVLLLATFL